MSFTSRTRRSLLLAATVLMPASFAAQAQTAAPAPPSKQDQWQDAITFGLQIEGGIIGNAASPRNGINFGHSFTDKSNDFQLNQVLATVTRPLDPKATGYDFGFKLQGLAGTDARYTRWTYFGQGQSHTRFQGDIVEANVMLHTPWLTEGGVDFKAGMYSTPMGAETIDPSTNSFYSKSYIFNFGLPFKQSGGYATVHATDMVDFYLGVDTGVNTSFFKAGDDNSHWYEMIGIQSTAHGPQQPISIAFSDKTNPIVSGMADWTTVNEELYNNVQVLTAKGLAKGTQKIPEMKDKKGKVTPAKEASSIVVWTNEFGPKKTRIFSTTLGHNNSTVEDPRYLDLVTRGLLWSVDKLGADGKPVAGYGKK